jgi:hypothetical protein
VGAGRRSCRFVVLQCCVAAGCPRGCAGRQSHHLVTTCLLPRAALLGADALCQTWQLQARARVKEVQSYPSIQFAVKSADDHVMEGVARTKVEPTYVGCRAVA